MKHRLFAIAVASSALMAPLATLGDEVDEQLAAIAKVGPQAAGSAEARAACDVLSQHDATILPRLLIAMQTPNPVAANWYRTAYEAIVTRAVADRQGNIPLAQLKQFVRNPKNRGRVRRLALALCDRLEPGFANKLVPRLLDDPEFRDDAVDAALAAGQQAIEDGDSETARDQFHRAFDHARSSDQVVRAAGKLTALGEKVDIPAHLGLVLDWWLIGPFDAPQFSGFQHTYPPEKHVDLRAKYTGQDGRELAWVHHRTADSLGLVNLAQALAPVKEAVGYAYTELDVPRATDAQLRCGADDNCTVWLNGEQVFARQQWLNGIRLDRFVTPVHLRAGKNQVLVKVCQGPQHKNPQVPNNWSLQLRFCDETGNGIRFRSLLPDVSEVSK